jgi:hypothetical protein
MKSLSACLASSFLFLAQWNAQAFLPASPGLIRHHRPNILSAANLPDESSSSSFVDHAVGNNQRRKALAHLAIGAAATVASLSLPSAAFAKAEESMYAPKFVQEYPDFAQSDEGWSYKDVKVGSGESPKTGDRVVYEWSGYTIGYFGRPFEAKGYVSGGKQQTTHCASRNAVQLKMSLTLLVACFLVIYLIVLF